MAFAREQLARARTGAVAFAALGATKGAIAQVANRVTNVWEAMAFPTAVVAQVAGRVKAGTVFGSGELTPARIDEIAAAATAVRTGNCLENACTAAVFAAGQGARNVSVYSVTNHLFTVIDVAEGCNPYDPATWGPDAWVVDAWANEAYAAAEYRQHKANKGFSGLNLECRYK